jgi:hypothetical protein
MCSEMQTRTLLASLLLLLGVNAAAQRPLPASAPGEPHAALARLAGTWEAHARFWSPDSSASPTECTATVNASMIMGGRFLFQKVEGQCMGASFSNMGTSIAPHVGEKNDAGDIVLQSSYQDQATGATVKRRTVRTMISENEWVETAHETRTSADQKVMEIRARRATGHDVPRRP